MKIRLYDKIVLNQYPFPCKFSLNDACFSDFYFQSTDFENTDEFSSNQNLPRELFRQVLNVAPGRFNDISFNAFDADGVSVPHTCHIPFETDDSISYKFTISPATGQHNLTSTTAFGARVYRIKLILKDVVAGATANTTPVD